MKLVPLDGQRFGRWLVMKRATSQRGMTRYLCACDCGREQEVFAKHLRSGSSRSCRSCSVLVGRAHPQWNGAGEISGGWWRDHVGRSVTLSARSPKEVGISAQDAWELFLQQGRRCALSGEELVISNDNQINTASIDRIDSSLGYVPGNVQWVHKHVNIMKNRFRQDRFIEICRKIAATCPIK